MKDDLKIVADTPIAWALNGYSVNWRTTGYCSNCSSVPETSSHLPVVLSYPFSHHFVLHLIFKISQGNQTTSTHAHEDSKTQALPQPPPSRGEIGSYPACQRSPPLSSFQKTLCPLDPSYCNWRAKRGGPNLRKRQVAPA